MYFYYIGNNYISKPLLLHKHKLKTKKVCFNAHGMCVVGFEFVQQKSNTKTPKDESCKRYKLKIILFGGCDNENILSSFLYLHVLVSYNCNYFLIKEASTLTSEQMIQISIIDENLIDENEIKLKNINEMENKNWYNFGFECIDNWKKEPVIVIVGGSQSDMANDVYLFNCATYQLERKKEVCLPVYVSLSHIMNKLVSIYGTYAYK